MGNAQDVQSSEETGAAAGEDDGSEHAEDAVAALGTAAEEREEEGLISRVVQAGCDQMIISLKAFHDRRGLKGHRVMAKLFSALSEFANDLRLSGHTITPEDDCARLGIGRVFTDLIRSVSGDGNSDSALEETVLMTPECAELLSNAARAISSISKLPGQAARLAEDGVLSSMSTLLKLYVELPWEKQNARVVWWVTNSLFFLLTHGEQSVLSLAMKDQILIQSLRTLAEPPWSSDKKLAVHISLVTSQLASGFHAESLALKKKLL